MLGPDEFVINLLVEQGQITAEQVADANRNASSWRCSSPQALIRAKIITARDVAIGRAMVSEVPFVDLDNYEIDVQVASLLPRTLADKAVALPLFNVGDVTTVAMADAVGTDLNLYAG